jgi:hypothetical protein
MADPRAVVSHEGNDGHWETYHIDNSTIIYSATEAGGSAQVGLAVTLSSDDTVALTADGNYVLGKLVSVSSDGFCSVQDGGYMTLPSGASATLTLGEAIVGDLDTSAKGYIRAVATGTAAELGHSRGAIINNNDTAAVVVKL